MKKIFIIDWLLVIAFILTAFSGFKLHIAGHFHCHDIWHNWAVCHTITSLLFVILAILHIKTHFGWYKSLINKGIGNKSRTTISLSATYLVTLITGIILLSTDGANSDVGLWHYRIGIVLTIISAIHLIMRFTVLQKSLKR